jgi:hypothetical protein
MLNPYDTEYSIKIQGLDNESIVYPNFEPIFIFFVLLYVLIVLKYSSCYHSYVKAKFTIF